MAFVRVTGWRPGLQKISMTKVYRRELGITLKPAKEMTDALLAGEVQEFEVIPVSRAEAIADELRQLGGVVDVLPTRRAV